MSSPQSPETASGEGPVGPRGARARRADGNSGSDAPMDFTQSASGATGTRSGSGK